ncbi:MAG TPA: hypothetical protein PKD10_17605 [Paracoccaceae bacterium]|nr:hypothetical protein [Paracoccaceae bacterium]HMO72898.1 hypothetical protein [Paracoccaceae bacterium]
MTDRIALALGLVLLVALAADLGLNGGQAGLFLARRMAGLIEWAAFWR